MDRLKEETWNMIARQLSGNLDEDERHNFDIWLKDPVNFGIYKSVKKDWEILDFKNETGLDENIAWNKVESRIKKQINSTNDHKSLRKQYAVIAIAALLITGLFTSVLFTDLFSENSTITAKSKKEPQQIELPDGSTAYLNSYSKLTYQKKFSDSKRAVTIQGEGFFSVKKEAERPFIVNTHKATVKVLGTKFSVRSYHNENVEVFLESGSVEVFNPSSNSQKTRLHPGEIASLNTGKEIIVSKNHDPNYLAWQSKKLVFKKTSLNEVANILENVYKKDIVLHDHELKNCYLTSVYHQQELKTIIESICLTFDLAYKEDKNQVVLYGKGCKP